MYSTRRILLARRRGKDNLICTMRRMRAYDRLQKRKKARREARRKFTADLIDAVAYMQKR